MPKQLSPYRSVCISCCNLMMHFYLFIPSALCFISHFFFYCSASTSLFPAHTKIVRRMQSQRSHVSLSNRSVCGLFFFVHDELCCKCTCLCSCYQSPSCGRSKYPSSLFNWLQDPLKENKTTWNNRHTFSCGLTPVFLDAVPLFYIPLSTPLFSAHTLDDNSTRQLPGILGCIFGSFNLVSQVIKNIQDLLLVSAT